MAGERGERLSPCLAVIFVLFPTIWYDKGHRSSPAEIFRRVSEDALAPQLGRLASEVALRQLPPGTGLRALSGEARPAKGKRCAIAAS